MITGGQAPLVVAAKLATPKVRTETIARHRVTRALAQAVERPLTVVCAPAGYGKTTALVEWLETSQHPHAWVTLDAGDNDPRRLCAHLLAALAPLAPGALEDAELALLDGSSLEDTVLPLTLNGLTDLADDGLTLVLDDCHLVERPACHRLLLALIDGAPPGMRLVVSSRSVQPLRLARRRAAGTVSELGAEQLRFQGAEPELLLNGSLSLGLRAAEVAAINAHVEGWPAGLALVAEALPAGGDLFEALSRSQASVAEYLVEEVLDHVSPSLRAFLCRTSFLTRLHHALCEAVLEDPAARELLLQARRANLFVTVDRDGWLRYHPLLAGVLQRELEAESPELVPTLHRRAAVWLGAHGRPEEAIRHAIAAGDGEHAAELLHDSFRTFVRERRYATLRELIADLPAERGRFASFCEALDTLCMALDGRDLRLIAQRLRLLERVRDDPGVGTIVDHLDVSPYFGHVSAAAKVGWRVWRSYADRLDMRAWLAGQFAVVLWFAGERDALRNEIEPFAGEIERPTSRAWALSALALTAAEDGDLDRAERYARDAVELAEASDGESALEFHTAYVALAEVLRVRGALDEARVYIEHAARVTGTLPTSLYHAFTLVHLAHLDLASRDRRGARTHATMARGIIERYEDVGRLRERLAAVETALQRRAVDPLLGSQPTPAEMRLLALLPSELTLKAIATDHLYVSINTVTSHAQRLYRRLGARTRAEAVEAARQRGLLDVNDRLVSAA